jgi:hypothetical protein
LTHQEVEIWAREIVEAVLANQRIEDSRVELKSAWPDPQPAARRLAGHANAARGTPILWLIGVDERNCSLTNCDPIEPANWLTSVQSVFDGFAPRMVIDLNFRIEGSTVVALYFETHQESPFVVAHTKGSYPEFVVPWREGTRLRAARRDELLRILVPIRRFSALVDELNYNLAVVKATPTNASVGHLFRKEEFDKVMGDGTLSTLNDSDRNIIITAYLDMNRAYQIVSAAINSLAIATTFGNPLDRAWQAVRDCKERIEAAREALSRFLKTT